VENIKVFENCVFSCFFGSFFKFNAPNFINATVIARSMFGAFKHLFNH